MLSEVDPAALPRRGRAGAAGYAHDSYVQSLAEFGSLVRLGGSGVSLLSRAIPGSPWRDAVGAYPLLVCDDFDALRQDFLDLGSSLVSVACVLDPFSTPSPAVLADVFDVAIPFKTHYVVDLRAPLQLRRHHRRYVSKALAAVEVQVAEQPVAWASEWAELYGHLVGRHRISGIQAFSPRALGQQLAVPGCLYFRAVRDGSAVGGLVCYLDRGVAYAHLISATGHGQELRAQYALYATALEYCRTKVAWFLLGGVPGPSDEESGGLAFFKAGWATGTLPAYLCGRILEPGRYRELCARRQKVEGPPYFPEYRAPVRLDSASTARPGARA
jgi:hypothetical protein